MRIFTMLRVAPSAPTKRLLALSWLAASILLLSGCSVVIQKPTDQATIAASAVAVNVGLPLIYRAGTFSARLNETDITSQFSVDAQNGTASAGLTLAPGQYALDVTACWGINILFVTQPPWPVRGCSNARSNFTAVQPWLVLGPSGLTVPVSRSDLATVQAIPAPTGALTVTLSSSLISTLSVPTTVTVPANSSVPVNIPVQGIGPGAATLSAAATGYTDASMNVPVSPLLTLLSPVSGPSGTVLNITGAGFVAPMTVNFGNTSIPMSPMSSTQLSVSVPQGLVVGMTPVTVTSKSQRSASLNFAVTSSGAVNLTLAQPKLVLERGKNGSLQVTIARMAPFSGDVVISTTGLPTGVSQTALTIPAGQTSSALTFSATAAAQFSLTSLTVKATGPSGVPTNSKPLALIVSRETGAFIEASPSPYLSTVPSSANSLSGTFRVDISLGAPTVPQPRKAVFFKGSQKLGNEIGFTLGSTSNLGGAGFCADNLSNVALPHGVVMSGNLPGFSSDNVFTTIGLTGNAFVQRQVPVESTKLNNFYFFQPRVFFSRDCTLALVAGSNKIGPSNNELAIIDLLTGIRLGNTIPFETSAFSATVVNLNNQPTVQVTTDINVVTNITIP